MFMTRPYAESHQVICQKVIMPYSFGALHHGQQEVLVVGSA